MLVRFTLLDLTSVPSALVQIVRGLQAVIQKFNIDVEDNIQGQSGDNSGPQGQVGICNINPYHSNFLKVCSYVG